MNDYIGQRVKLKFRLVSDQFVTYDGYYIDDFQFVTLLDASSSTPLDTGHIDSAASVNEVQNDLQVKLYPNPATNEVRIIHDLGNEIMIKVFDLQGNMVIQKSHIDRRIKLDVSMLSTGSYLISCEYGDDVYRQPLLIIR